MENRLITGRRYSAHTHTHTHADAGRWRRLHVAVWLVAKRWEGRGAPLCAKLMRFHIVLISSRCGAEHPPPPHPRHTHPDD